MLTQSVLGVDFSSLPDSLCPVNSTGHWPRFFYRSFLLRLHRADQRFGLRLLGISGMPSPLYICTYFRSFKPEALVHACYSRLSPDNHLHLVFPLHCNLFSHTAHLALQLTILLLCFYLVFAANYSCCDLFLSFAARLLDCLLLVTVCYGFATNYCDWFLCRYRVINFFCRRKLS